MLYRRRSAILGAVLLLAAPICKARGPEFGPFVKAFVASCTSEDQRAKQFHLSHIHFPLNYTFTTVSAEGKRSESGNMQEPKLNPYSGGLSLPLCVGDGGLEEINVASSGVTGTVGLVFGSGPNEELRFQLIKGEWQLVSAEWFDH